MTDSKTVHAEAAGTINVGGDLTVNRARLRRHASHR